MNRKQDYLNTIYNVARLHGLCHTKQEFAALMAINPSTMSRAMAGDEKYLTDNLINRIKVWAEQAGLDESHPIASVEEKEIVIPAATAVFYQNLSEALKNMSQTLKMQQELINQLQPGVHISESKKRIG